ncbi:hypothetical protein ACA910_006333 [Epithemia clementina (nom. ined.)]
MRRMISNIIGQWALLLMALTPVVLGWSVPSFGSLSSSTPTPPSPPTTTQEHQQQQVLHKESVSASSTTSPIPVSSRRNFVATAAAAAMTGSFLTAAATARPAMAASSPSLSSSVTAMDLVEPHSLDGQVIVITGATTGLGLESAKALALGGATVVMTARTPAKGVQALQQVQDFLQQQGVTNDKVYTVQLDLDNLQNVKSFPERLQKTLGGGGGDDTPLVVDTLMNNAGVMAIPERQLTVDGYERTFQSNHLGHFVLTAQLAPYLSPNARIINVSSMAYTFASSGLHLDNLNGESDYSPWGSYGQSKLENILFARELQRRVDQTPGLSWTVTSLHPGTVNTDLARNMMGGDEAWFAKKQSGPSNPWESLVNSAITKTLKTPEQGAATQVYLAVTPTTTAPTTWAEKGQFFSDLKPQKLPPFATDDAMAKALWERSEELSGVTFKLERPRSTTTAEPS